MYQKHFAEETSPLITFAVIVVIFSALMFTVHILSKTKTYEFIGMFC